VTKVKLVRDMMNMYMLYYSGNVSYEEFAAFFRKKECLAVQYLLLMVFLAGASIVMNIPIIIAVFGAVIMLYGVILVSFARTAAQQFIYSAVWGITTFLALCILLFVAVRFFGFEGF
jgi:hypothetical protein